MAAKRKVLYGKAPLTIVRTLDGRRVYVYRNKPCPANLSSEERDRLVDGGYLEEREVAEDELAEDGADAFDVSTLGTVGIDKTKVWVGEDVSRAKQALAAEQAKPVDGQRNSLVTWLEKITDPA
jgi:hypothetical protein